MAKFRGKWTAQRGDFIARCDYCGARYLRSEMSRDGSGSLVCPLEGDGLDSVTLSEANAEMAGERRGRINEEGSNLGDDLLGDDI